MHSPQSEHSVVGLNVVKGQYQRRPLKDYCFNIHRRPDKRPVDAKYTTLFKGGFSIGGCDQRYQQLRFRGNHEQAKRADLRGILIAFKSKLLSMKLWRTAARFASRKLHVKN